MSGACQACESKAVTQISITMADGSIVEFTSCHTCEAKSYRSGGKELPLEKVLALAARRK